MKSTYNLPENELAANDTQHETIQSYYLLKREVMVNAFHNNILGNQLTRSLNALTPALVEEFALAFERNWGSDEKEWRDVVAWQSCIKIIAGGANRVFVGTPLCNSLPFVIFDHHG